MGRNLHPDYGLVEPYPPPLRASTPPNTLLLPPSNAFTGFFRIVRRTKIFFSPAGFAVERTRILPVFVSPPPVWNQILPAGSETAHSEEEINECSHCQQPVNEEHNNRQTSVQ